MLTKERKRRRATTDSDESGAEADDTAASEKTKKRKKRSKKAGDVKERVPRKKPGEEGYDPFDFDSEAEDSQEGKSVVWSASCFSH